MANILLIGSTAVNQHFNFRDNHDIDMVGHEQDFFQLVRQNHLRVVKIMQHKAIVKCMTTHKFIEFTFIDQGGVYEMVYHAAMKHGQVQEVENLPYLNQLVFPSLEFLLALKLTHRFKDSVHFDKTRADIHALQACGISALKHQMFADIEKAFLRPPVKLSETADKFFRKTDKFYQANHDDIHQSILAGDRPDPAYKLILGEQAEVYCDPVKWLELPHESKLRCVVEEACTLAIERIFIPHHGLAACASITCDEQQARHMFRASLRKLCTRITSGRFRTFAWDHVEQVHAMYESEYQPYVMNFISACAKGQVREFIR